MDFQQHEEAYKEWKTELMDKMTQDPTTDKFFIFVRNVAKDLKEGRLNCQMNMQSTPPHFLGINESYAIREYDKGYATYHELASMCPHVNAYINNMLAQLRAFPLHQIFQTIENTCNNILNVANEKRARGAQ